MVEVAKLAVVAGEPQRAPVGGAKPHAPRADLLDARGLAVQQPARLVVVRPPDPVARAELDRCALAHPDAVAHVVARVDAPGRALGMAQRHRALLHPDDEAGLAVAHPVAQQILREHHFVARLVVRKPRLLARREVQVNEALQRERAPVHRALGNQPLAHRGVDVAAHRMRRRDQERLFPLGGPERQERVRGALGERLRLDLLQPLAEVGERARGSAGERLAHRLAQHRVRAGARARPSPRWAAPPPAPAGRPGRGAPTGAGGGRRRAPRARRRGARPGAPARASPQWPPSSTRRR